MVVISGIEEFGQKIKNRIMKTFINSYLNSLTDSHLETGDFPGPVVTISREPGCSAQRIAIKLSKILTGYSYMSDTKTDNVWQWVNNDIVRTAILEMNEEVSREKENYNDEYKKHLNDVVKAFSKELVGEISDPSVLQPIKNVICKLAIDGRYIIVGRAANIILKDLPNKLSVKLEAPKEWRINRVMQMDNLSLAEAEAYINEKDAQREQFIRLISGREPNNYDYDLIFNYSTMLDDHIVDVIVNVLRNKKIISIGDYY
jgi:cytidylate kinase